MTDYSNKIHTESANIAKELISILSEKKDIFITNFTDDAELIKKQEEYNADLANEIIKILSTKDIPADYATFAIDKIVENLAGLKAFIDGTIRSYHDEFASRSYGYKNEEGKYRREVVTVGQLMLKLDEVREATGGNPYDFYNEVAPEMPTE